MMTERASIVSVMHCLSLAKVMLEKKVIDEMIMMMLGDTE